MLDQAVAGAERRRCGEKVAALGLPLLDSDLVGLLVARAEVYLNGNMLLYIKSPPSCSCSWID